MHRTWILIEFPRCFITCIGHMEIDLVAMENLESCTFSSSSLPQPLNNEKPFCVCIYGKFQFPIFHYAHPVSLPCHHRHRFFHSLSLPLAHRPKTFFNLIIWLWFMNTNRRATEEPETKLQANTLRLGREKKFYYHRSGIKSLGKWIWMKRKNQFLPSEA